MEHNPKISFLVTTHNEEDTLNILLKKLTTFKTVYSDSLYSCEIVVIDDYSTNENTLKILEEYSQNIRLFKHKLDRNYGAHKNYGNEQCKGNFICQLDGDECPTDTLLANLSDIIDSNPTCELFYLPRQNKFSGVTSQDAAMWNWRLNEHGEVNYPDYQSRLYKNVPDIIKWDRRLHEKIIGHSCHILIPQEMRDLSIIHVKTIEKQRETNIRYNEWFTAEENQGHVIK